MNHSISISPTQLFVFPASTYLATPFNAELVRVDVQSTLTAGRIRIWIRSVGLSVANKLPGPARRAYGAPKLAELMGRRLASRRLQSWGTKRRM